MAGTFLRVTSKLEWAKEQIRAIRKGIQRFEESEGRVFRTEPHPRAGSYQPIKVLWSPTSAGPEPLDGIGHAVGDAVHNLRATLDYLIYELNIRRRGGTEPRSIPPGHRLRKTQFPIFLDEAEFDGKAGRGPGATKMLAGLTRKQRARIKKLQPFRKPDHPLWVLSELDNLGKHRHAHILLRLDRVWLDPPLAEKFGFKTAEGIKPGKRYKEGTKVTILTKRLAPFDPESIEAQVNMALKRTLSIVFDKGSPAEGRDVVQELRRLQRHVARVMKELSRYFSV